MGVINTKSNATLAAELKKLGFKRATEKWNKSEFIKLIGTSSLFQNMQQIKITVRINRGSFVNDDWDDSWCVDSVQMATETFRSDLRVGLDTVDMTSEAMLELSETLNAIEALK